MSRIVAPLPAPRWQPEQLPEFDDLVDSAFGQPRPDPLPDEVAVLPSPDLETQLRDLGQLRAVDHRREIQPLLAGDHGDPDVAVFGRLDRRHFDGARHRRRLQQVGVQRFAALHQRDCFQHGQIQVFAWSAVLDAAAHGQRPECGEDATHVLAEVATDRDRRSGWVTAETGQAGPRLQGELAGGSIGIGTAPAEVGNGDDDRPRELCQQQLRIDVPLHRLRPGGRHHDDVGAGDLGAKVRSRPGQAALAGIEIPEQGRVRAVRDGRSARAEPPQPIPLWRLDFPDVSTRVDQQLSAVAAGDAVADLDNTDVRQRCWSAAVPVAQPVSVYIRRVVVYAILVNLPIRVRSCQTERLTSAAIMPLLLRLQCYGEFRCWNQLTSSFG